MPADLQVAIVDVFGWRMQSEVSIWSAKVWTEAMKNGCAGRRQHDFRGIAVRNVVKAGLAERAAMTATGHETRAAFDGYHLVSPGDLQDVARRLTGHPSGKLRPRPLTTVPQVARIADTDD